MEGKIEFLNIRDYSFTDRDTFLTINVFYFCERCELNYKKK